VGKISGCGYLSSLKAGFEAGIQSFRKHLLVLAQAAARHGDGVSAGAHRTLYSLSHYSLTSRTCPINDMSLGGSHAMCGRMSRYVGPSFHHSMYDTAVSLQGGSFELAKVIEIRYSCNAQKKDPLVCPSRLPSLISRNGLHGFY